jgi:hypothetical protein
MSIRSSKGIVLALGLAALLAAFLLGRLPRQRELERLRSSEATASASVRAGEILGRLLLVQDLVDRQDFGRAASASTALFDALREEAARTHRAEMAAGLREALARRDAVTAALARGDPGALELLKATELQIRSALGYPVP